MTLVRHARLEEERDVGVVQTVEDEPALSPRLHQPERAQEPEVLRDRRVADAEDDCNITGAELLVQQHVDDLGSSGIPQGVEERRQIEVRGLFDEAEPRSLHCLRMQTARLTETCLLQT